MKQGDMLRMANQIAANLKALGPQASTAVAEHIHDFWDPRMRQSLLEHVGKGGAGLDALVLDAVRELQARAEA